MAICSVSITDFKAALRGYKRVLEDLARINTVGKLANLKINPNDLADLRSWQVETDDLTELDVVGVLEGDEVSLTFDAIPDLELPGHVLRVKPLGEEKLGDVTYTVVVVPDEQDPRLKWGMTAVVTLP